MPDVRSTSSGPQAQGPQDSAHKPGSISQGPQAQVHKPRSTSQGQKTMFGVRAQVSYYITVYDITLCYVIPH